VETVSSVFVNVTFDDANCAAEATALSWVFDSAAIAASAFWMSDVPWTLSL
jgi:hypothetical protein